MTNEAVIVELSGDGGNVTDFTISSSAAIEKGTLMALYDPRTASGAVTNGLRFAGIAASEKVAADTAQTNLGLYTYGIFDCVACGAITCGQRVILSGTNCVAAAASTDIDAGYDFGQALETASDAERIEVFVGR